MTIIQAQQLAGLDIDPVIRVDIGPESRYTSISKSTNCPYYNEYFVFDYHEPAAMVLDKMITISVIVFIIFSLFALYFSLSLSLSLSLSRSLARSLSLSTCIRNQIRQKLFKFTLVSWIYYVASPELLRVLVMQQETRVLSQAINRAMPQSIRISN